MKNTSPLIPLCAAIASLFLISGGPYSHAWRTDMLASTPTAPFINSPDEEIKDVHITSGSAEDIQQQIDDTRAANPDAILVIRLEGQFSVGTEPIKLGSRMNLLMEEGSALIADSQAAGHMIEIRNASLSGVYGPGPGQDPGIIDGNMRASAGIVATGSEKVHFSYLEVKNCLGHGIEYEGKGDENFGSAGSVTHSRIINNQGAGAVIRGTPQFVFTDNLVSGNRKGLQIESHTSVAADNIFRNNSEGAVLTHSNNGTVARNTFIGSGSVIRLSESSESNLVTYNTFEPGSPEPLIAIDGRRNAVYYNDFGGNTNPFELAGEENIIASHRGVSGQDTVEKIGENLYFNPPTRSNQHEDEIIVAGMGRRDIEIDSQGPVSNRPRYAGIEGRVEEMLEEMPHIDLSDVQKRIDEERDEHPDDYLVVHLKGLFISTGSETGLKVPDYVSVILDGSIIARTTGQARMILLEGEEFSSFSGGYIDGSGGKASHGVDAPGSAITIIDGVTVTSMHNQGISTVSAYDPPFTSEGAKKGRGNVRGRPVFIRGNSVANIGTRGIWGHIAADTYYIDNVVLDTVSDGIDIDAWNNYSVLLFNTLRGNNRSGVFIEEGVNHNIIYGNHIAANRGGSGFGVLYYSFIARRARQRGDEDWSRLRNHNNVIAGNLVEANNVGMNNRYSEGCVFLHNTFRHNNKGIRFGHNAANSYIAQNTIYDNNLADIDQDERKMQEAEFYSFSAPMFIILSMPQGL